MANKIRYLVLFLILALTFNFGLTFRAPLKETNERIESLENELEVMRSQIQTANEEIESLKTKEVILVMGDSLIIKSDWVQILDKLLSFNYPSSNYNVITSAKGGERAHKGRERFGYSVAVHKPQIIVFAYGTNDVRGGNVQDFESSMEKMVIQAKDLGAEVFINLIGPIDIPDSEHYHEFNNVIKQIALRNDVTVIDVLTPLSEHPDEYFIDGVYYNYKGSLIVARAVFDSIKERDNGK